MKKFCNGCIHEGDYSNDPHGVNFVSDNIPKGYIPLIDCDIREFVYRKKNSNLTCSYYEKGGQLSLFD